MKTLLLLRHAKSAWKNASLPDIARPLNKRGLREAPRVGTWLRAQHLLPDVILSSTATRARMTTLAVLETSGYAGPVHLLPQLYEATLATLIATLNTVAEPPARVVLVGHNPALEELLTALTGHSHHIATATVVQLLLPIATWRELTLPTAAHFVGLWRPGKD
jgi:phosphohistidine phosphatase